MSTTTLTFYLFNPISNPHLGASMARKLFRYLRVYVFFGAVRLSVSRITQKLSVVNNFDELFLER